MGTSSLPSTYLCAESIVQQRSQTVVNRRRTILGQSVSIRRWRVQFHIEVLQCSSHTIDHFLLNLVTFIPQTLLDDLSLSLSHLIL